MLKKIKVIIVIMFLCIFSFKLECSASDSINFRSITIEEGLAQSTVETMLQDEKGYIWIGTNDGLNRYNGHEFKVFTQKKGSENNIVNNYIIDLEEDFEGNIWVGTINGVSKISGSGEIITNYLDEEDNGNLSHYNIGDMIVLKNGDILVGTIGGLDIYDENTDSFVPYIEQGKLTNDEIYSLDQDEHGNIWVGTTEGLNMIQYNTREVVKYTHDGTVNSIPNDVIYKVYCDKNDIVWLGTYSSGAYRLDVRTGEITHYTKKEWGLEERVGEHIRNFYRDSNDTLWVCTSGGLIKYDDENNKSQLYKHKSYDKRSLVDDSIFTIMEDDTGLLWVGTYAGISMFDSNNGIKHYKNDPFEEKSLNSNMVQGLYEDEDGFLWVGTNSSGVNILDKNRDNISTITKENNISLTSNRINDIEGYKNLIFLATNDGLNIVDKNTRNIKVYREQDGLPSRNIKNLFLDDKNYLWIGTMNGFCILDINTRKVKDINYIFDKYNLNDRYSGAIYQDKDGFYWIGSMVNGGVFKLDPYNNEVKHYKYDENNKNSIIDNSIRVISEDEEGNIWIGTSNGLSIYSKSKDKFENFTTENGLPNNTIYGILLDDEGRGWLSTNGGISAFSKAENKFVNFNVIDGLQSNEFNGEAYLKTHDGELFFGGVNGLNSFYPNNIEIDMNTQSIEFDELFVNGVKVESISGKKFSHDENNIKIQVFLPEYKNVKGIRYYYMLEGADNDWVQTNTPKILFSNLSAGNYNFRIKAINSKGIISKEANVTFEIKKPLWASGTAFVTYMIIIIYVILLQKNKVKRLDNLVDKRTNELFKEMNKNKKLFNKVITLEKNKNNYLINLSHELRTPLNVLHTTEQLISTLNQQEILEKNKLDYYLNILRKNNKRLLNLINNLIDISKLENGKYIISKKEIDIVYLVEEVALSLKDYIEEKGIELIIDPEIEERIVSCDPHDIERCVINLISNAVKFTNSGGTIKVVLKDLKDSIRIIVEDTGIGIEKENQSLIFNRFNQVVDINAEIKGGSGLGLTITKQIIDLHNGSIIVQSELGKGSTFIIELPV